MTIGGASDSKQGGIVYTNAYIIVSKNTLQYQMTWTINIFYLVAI